MRRDLNSRRARTFRVAKATVTLVLAFVLLGSAEAKDLQTMLLVGSRGDSKVIHADSAVLDQVHDYAGRRPVRAPARGPYVQIYLLGPSGLPGVPGRFYPRTKAACFSWDRARHGSPCSRPSDELLVLLEASDALEPFRGAPTTIGALRRSDGRPVFAGSEPMTWANLEVALEMAFGRARASRQLERKPSQCIELSARWRGPQASSRPGRFCLSRVVRGRGAGSIPWAGERGRSCL
jgi:hypothetical protein